MRHLERVRCEFARSHRQNGRNVWLHEADLLGVAGSLGQFFLAGPAWKLPMGTEILRLEGPSHATQDGRAIESDLKAFVRNKTASG